MKHFIAPTMRIIHIAHTDDILASSPVEPSTQTETYEVETDGITTGMWE